MDGHKGTPYQPPLLTLDDMLNLSNDDDNWDSSAFNISNFFEPIVSPRKNVQPTKKEGDENTTTDSRNATSYLHSFASSIVPDDTSIVENLQAKSHHFSPPNKICSSTAQIKPEPVDQSNFELFLNAHEASVNDEIQESASKKSNSLHESPELTSCGISANASETGCEPGQQEQVRVSPKPTPRKVNEADESKNKDIIICNERRKTAIFQLQSLISTLKRYSKTLQSFLENEGDLIIEQHVAQELLGETSKIKHHPLDVAHSVTQAITSYVGGHTDVSRLPRRRPVIWRSSDLLLLQKSILQSVISRREFFLDSRYSQLLLEMGFDLEDIDRLNKSPTKQCELATLKILLEEHDRLSKLKDSVKKPIQTVVLKTNTLTGVPLVFSLSKPETLVVQKWEKLVEIRKETLLSNISEKDIDWLYVIKQMSRGNPFLYVEEEECKLTYSHLIDSKYNNAPWHADEVMKLKAIREKYASSTWASVSNRLGTQRSPFSCFVKYRIHCEQTSPQVFFQNQSVLDYYVRCYKGNIARMDYEMFKVTGNYMKPMTLLVAIKRTINPRSKHGKFSVMEDVLLLLTMERYREHLLETENFEPVAYALPWRYITYWRGRFGRIMTGFYSKKWTLEDDQCLWKLVQEYGPKYKLIQRSFPHKDRKQCRARYVHLQQVLKTTSLEQYHVMYNNRKRNVDFDKLNRIATLLDMTIKAKRMGGTKYVREADLEFLRLRQPPSDRELECYVLTFQQKLMCTALERLLDCLFSVRDKFRDFSSKMSIPQTLCGINRRKFDPKCPASTASALHLSHAKLVPLNHLENLSQFESDVYKYYQFFSTGSVKKKTKRSFLPAMDLLRKLPSIKRLIQPAESGGGGDQPIFIISSQTLRVDHDAEAQKEAEVLEEIQKQTKRGIIKGAKRKSTKIREDKSRAAKMRWQKSKSANVNEQLMKENIPSDKVLFNTVKCELESENIPSPPMITADSTSGIAVRNAVVAMINDHSYILPMDNPTNLQQLSLGQLFAKMGHQDIQE